MEIVSCIRVSIHTINPQEREQIWGVWEVWSRESGSINWGLLYEKKI